MQLCKLVWMGQILDLFYDSLSTSSATKHTKRKLSWFGTCWEVAYVKTLHWNLRDSSKMTREYS
jgi:hypothetical protein